MLCYVFFFFKQKTAYEMRISDWSSDVCSSDLHRSNCLHAEQHEHEVHVPGIPDEPRSEGNAGRYGANPMPLRFGVRNEPATAPENGLVRCSRSSEQAKTVLQ